MSLKYLLYFVIVFFANRCLAQESTFLSKWSYNTAGLMQSGKWESGLIQPFRYGINKKIEVRANILIMPFIPNAGVLIAQGTKNDISFASEHILSIPTPFLNFFSMQGTGGLISSEYDFSFILSVYNALLASKQIATNTLLTAKIGYVFAIRSEKPDPNSTIDLPVFYSRMAHYYEGTSIKPGIAVKGKLGDKWFYEEGLQAFVITRPENNFFIENTGTLMWAIGGSWRIRGGYILAYGKYPYETPKWQLWPTFDVVFGSR
jgi:hypothetical protein